MERDGAASFSPALELNRAFYVEIVGPLLDDIPHAAARLGWGSEVLGFDSERSTDHGWGPQLQIFVDGVVVDEAIQRIDESLPETFDGWPVRYGWDAVEPRHHVYVSTADEWLRRRLGLNPLTGVSPIDWLRMPQQRLLEVTAGAVYRDDLGAITWARELLASYPDDTRLWMIACQWRRLAQEEAFVGRAAEVDDDIGSALVTARLARELMRLWFLFSRTYWPYTKWFGSAFARLAGSESLGSFLHDAMSARDYSARESALVRAYEAVASRHNELAITQPVEPTARLYFGRPYRVIHADRFVDASLDELRASPFAAFPLIGSIDQFVDSTDVLSDPETFSKVAATYDELLRGGER